MLYSPGKRCPHVVVLLVQPIQPRGILCSPQHGLGLFREGQEVLGVRTPHGIRLPALLKLLVRELADGLQHHEARFISCPFFLPQEALVKERGGAFEYVRRKISLSVAYHLHGLQCCPAREDSKPSEEHLLALVEQPVTPFDGVPERSLPLG